MVLTEQNTQWTSKFSVESNFNYFIVVKRGKNVVKLQLAHVWSNDRVLAQDKIFSKVDFLQSVVKEENDERMNEQTSSSFTSRKLPPVDSCNLVHGVSFKIILIIKDSTLETSSELII